MTTTKFSPAWGKLAGIFTLLAAACGGVYEPVPGDDATPPAEDAPPDVAQAIDGASDASPAVRCMTSVASLNCNGGEFDCVPPASNKPMNCAQIECQPGWTCYVAGANEPSGVCK